MVVTLIHSFILLASIIAAYAWSTSQGAAYYNLQITGLVIVIYFLLRLIIKKNRRLVLLIDSSVFTSLTLLLVLATGSIHSPVFFLLYFLLFAISLLFEPVQSGLITFALVIIFILRTGAAFDNLALINLVTLVLITPLAITLGNKYLETLVSLGKIQILKKIISQEETDSLLWLSTQAKPSLSSVINSLGDILIYLNSVGNQIFPANLVTKVKQIQSDLILLYKSTDALKEVYKDSDIDRAAKSEKETHQ